MEPINRYLDAAILKPEINREDTVAAIATCLRLNTKTVCVRPCDIELAKEMCAGTDTGVCVVLGFPHGVGLDSSKVDEARRYTELGVDEIDMVINYGYARSGHFEEILTEVASVVSAARGGGVANMVGVPVKVIFETSQLDIPTVERLVDLCVEAHADYVKTSTGFNGEGATEEVVKAMIDRAAGRIKVKPSGGIRDYERAKMFVEMGADRLGVGYTSCEAICGGGKAEGSGY